MQPVLDTQYGQQDEKEFAWLLQRMRGSASILEVGSSYGHSLRMFAVAAKPGACIRSIDLGTDRFVEDDNSVHHVQTADSLMRAIADLQMQGYDADAWIGDSHSAAAITWATKDAPYDFVFLDGDHTYEGVLADWKHYGPLGRLVGFHDMMLMEPVMRLWKEIKSTGIATEEYGVYQPQWKRTLGIGIVKQ